MPHQPTAHQCAHGDLQFVNAYLTMCVGCGALADAVSPEAPTFVTPEQIEAMRGHLLDCIPGVDVEQETAEWQEATRVKVVTKIARDFEGGVPAFLLAEGVKGAERAEAALDRIHAATRRGSAADQLSRIYGILGETGRVVP